MTGYLLYERAGWGSAIVEAQLAWYGLPHRLEAIEDVFTSASERTRLGAVNPVAQVPTLVLPDGAVMTESAAITLHLADVTGRHDLVPAPGDDQRPAFLRWLVFLVANIYPTFTYADVPTRFVPEAAAQAFRANVDAYAERLWRMVEAAAGAPWFLGERMSAIDIYLGVMTRWRPKPPWFERHTPKIYGSGGSARSHPRLHDIFLRNFPDPAAT